MIGRATRDGVSLLSAPAAIMCDVVTSYILDDMTTDRAEARRVLAKSLAAASPPAPETWGLDQAALAAQDRMMAGG